MNNQQTSHTAPPAAGVRLAWAALPAAVRHAVEKELGSTVVTATSQPSGFSPGVAARLRLADGRGLFLKAVGPKPNPTSPAAHRREAAVVAALPTTVPVPRLLGVYYERPDGWVVLWFEEIAGRHPAQPWQSAELDRVLDALIALGDRLTPSPLPTTFVDTAGAAFRDRICGWAQLAAQPPAQLAERYPWAARHLTALAALEADAPSAAQGNTLLHFDLRADNILLTDEQVWIVDWPHVRMGAPWIDLACFAPSVTMQGGPHPEQLLARHPAAQHVDPAAITAVVAAIAGYFIYGSLQPDPPGLPTLRAFQAAQGRVALAWLQARTGWR